MMVSEVSLGNWLTGGSISQKDARNCIYKAIDMGVTTFDTADIYNKGKAEMSLGDALCGMNRSDFEIFTKVYFPMSNHHNDRGLSRKHIFESLDKSLDRLRMDYVDLYQAHRFDYSTPLEETMLAFSDIVRSGKALYIGVSEWTADQIKEAKVLAEDLNVPLISNQPQYSILHRAIENEVVDMCKTLGLSQIVWSPLAQGLLTGKYRVDRMPSGSRFSNKDISKRIGPFEMGENNELLYAVEEFAKACEKFGSSPAAVAVAWVLRNQNVASAIVGATKPEQLEESLKGSDTILHNEIVEEVDAIFKNHIIVDQKSQSPDNIRSC